jgi:hypothetical protein
VQASAIVIVGSFSTVDWSDAELQDDIGSPHIPFACQQILGKSPVERMVSQLWRSGIRRVLVAVPERLRHLAGEIARGYTGVKATCNEIGPWLENKNEENSGDSKLIVIRVGAYVEFDAKALLEAHSSQSVAQARDARGPLDIWVADSAACHSVGELRRLMFSSHSASLLVEGYVNRLIKAEDVRQLAKDMMQGSCAAQPCGQQTKPRVWIADGARVHPQARIVAPAYVGAACEVGAFAIVGRFAAVESHCHLASGTRIEDASVLSYTRVGPELCVSNCIIDGDELVHFRSGAVVTVSDERLLSRMPHAPAYWFEPERSKAAHHQSPVAVQMKTAGYKAEVETTSLGLVDEI